MKGTMGKNKIRKSELTVAPTKIDLGAGKNGREGFYKVDAIDFPGLDLVHDLREPWPWADASVHEYHASHFVEHLKPMERVHFVNEMFRTLVPVEYGADGKPSKGFATIVCPHWSSCRAYGDMTHEWPPLSEFWLYYLKKEWRDVNAPHNDFYKCNFEASWGYSLHPSIIPRNSEYQTHAMNFWKEACQDIIVTLIKPAEVKSVS